jgi:two-component system, OmpR family, KDP operon response regulator KdpE
MSTADAPTRPRILFVDDSVFDLWALRNTMAARGFDLDDTGDPRTGLEMAKAHRPDIAVLDYSMNPYDGVTLCNKLKTLYPDLYVVFVSNHRSAEVRRRCLEVGDKFLGKPYKGEELVETISTAYIQRAGEGYSTAPASHGPPPPEPLAPDLTPKEWLLLKELKARAGETVARDELILALWGDVSGGPGALDKLVSRLRRKIEPEPKHPRILFTFREDGYRLDLPALRRAHGNRY